MTPDTKSAILQAAASLHLASRLIKIMSKDDPSQTLHNVSLRWERDALLLEEEIAKISKPKAKKVVTKDESLIREMENWKPLEMAEVK